MKLNELFSSEMEVQQEESLPYRHSYSFQINDKKYWATFTKQREKNFDVWGFYFKDDAGQQGITGSGDAIKVFASIKQIFFKFMRKVNPQIVQFTANEPSRIKLYNRFSKQLQRKGFRVEVKRRSGGVYYFVINET